MSKHTDASDLSEPVIIFEFDEHPGLYAPGDVIAGQCVIRTSRPADVKAVELSVLWYTLGKGDEDLAVHYFEREAAGQNDPLDLSLSRRFAAVLPESPLSYDGLLVKICWCVRARVQLRGGKDIVSDQPFQLGCVPRPQPVVRGEEPDPAAPDGDDR